SLAPRVYSSASRRNTSNALSCCAVGGGGGAAPLLMVPALGAPVRAPVAQRGPFRVEAVLIGFAGASAEVGSAGLASCEDAAAERHKTPSSVATPPRRPPV